jgi:hypothetical protein
MAERQITAGGRAMRYRGFGWESPWQFIRSASRGANAPGPANHPTTRPTGQSSKGHGKAIDGGGGIAPLTLAKDLPLPCDTLHVFRVAFRQIRHSDGFQHFFVIPQIYVSQITICVFFFTQERSQLAGRGRVLSNLTFPKNSEKPNLLLVPINDFSAKCANTVFTL